MASLFAIVALALGVAAQGDHGVTWDEVIGDLPHGERRLEFLTTLDPARLDPARMPAAASVEGHLEYPTSQFAPEMIYSVAPIVSAVCCRVFFQATGVLSSVSAHHLVAVLSAALLLALVVQFLGRRASVIAGTAAALLLATSPRFAAHAVNNVKDMPEALLYTAAFLGVFVALERGTRARWLWVGVLSGLALAQKGNALFLGPQALLLALVFVLNGKGPGRQFPWRGFAWAAAATLVTYLAASPTYWVDPSALVRHFEFVFEKGRVDPIPFVGADGERLLLLAVDPLDGLKNALWTTPEPLLLLAAVGLFARRVDLRLRAALAIGVLVPVGRTLVPGAINFDGVRHFLEYLPPLAMLAGLGVGVLRDALSSWRPTSASWGGVLLVALSVLPGAWLIGTTYPNEVCAFTESAGGLSGVRASGMREADDYWGNSFPAALRWIDATAPRDTQVVVPVAPHLVKAVRASALAPDRRVTTLGECDPERPVDVVVLHRERFFGAAVRELRRTIEPVHVILVQGGTILEVFRLDAATVRALQRIDAAALAARGRLWSWVGRNPERSAVALALIGERHLRGVEATLRALREVLPPERLDDAAAYLR